MKKSLLTTIALCILFVNLVAAQAFIDKKLKAAIASTISPVQVVVTFKGTGAPTAAHKTILSQVGITKGVTLRALPVAGLLATAAQVNALAQNTNILSLYLNTSLQKENNAATALTGVDKLRTDPTLTTKNGGLPVSGKGIGILVNDSGVDGTHPDLTFGRNLKQNVLAATNLNAIETMLPYTIVENVPNTDATGGHGTHVAGIAGGTGQASQGKYEGVAPGATLVGYGSGAALLLLDVLSGFDYAITHQTQYNIRVITNSFGTTSDLGTAVNPADPITLATKRCVDRNIVVVFSAGNSGPGSGTITGQYKKAPWVICVAAGDKAARLASFSSRGIKSRSGSFVLDGTTFKWEDRPSVTAPGVAIVSTRAISPTGVLGTDTDIETIEPAYLPYYTTLDGTSMAAPHVAGIVALMLDANPTLTPAQVKDILQKTASNIPARQSWEVGAGYANAYAAVDKAFRMSGAIYGSTLNLNRAFRSSVLAKNTTNNFTIDFNPATAATNIYKFNVPAGTTAIEASAQAKGIQGETGNPVNLSLISPSGVETRSGISVLFAISYNRGVAVASPEAGTWTVKLTGLNGVAFPEKISGTVNLLTASGTSGLTDITGHPAEASIKLAVSNRLVDGLTGGVYKPNDLLKRLELADYLMMGQGIRQFLPVNGSFTLTDVTDQKLLAESVVAKGAALRDVNYKFNGVMLPAAAGKFNPGGSVNRASLAYSLVQALGLQEAALARNSRPVTVTVDGKTIPIDDAAKIPAGLAGYVSIALELNMINAYFSVIKGPNDSAPVLHASFKPTQSVTRGDFAVIITRTFTQWNAATQPIATQAARIGETETASAKVTTYESVAYPNPFSGNTTITYALPEAGQVNIEVYDALGKKIKTLVSESKPAGTYSINFDGSNLASGTYLYKIKAGNQVSTKRLLVNH